MQRVCADCGGGPALSLCADARNAAFGFARPQQTRLGASAGVFLSAAYASEQTPPVRCDDIAHQDFLSRVIPSRQSDRIATTHSADEPESAS